MCRPWCMPPVPLSPTVAGRWWTGAVNGAKGDSSCGRCQHGHNSDWDETQQAVEDGRSERAWLCYSAAVVCVSVFAACPSVLPCARACICQMSAFLSFCLLACLSACLCLCVCVCVCACVCVCVCVCECVCV